MTPEGLREIGGIHVAPDQSWRFEISDFPALLDALGERVVTAFSCCFVHADRLNGLTEFGAMSLSRHGEHTAAHERNLHVMFWFVLGTLHELSIAIGSLRDALENAKMLRPEAAEWKELTDLESWARADHRRRIRNKIAFHVDAKLVRNGLRELGKEKIVLLARGDNPQLHTTEMSLGMDSLLRGLNLRKDAQDLKEVVEAASRYQLVFNALQQLFLDVLQQKAVRGSVRLVAEPAPDGPVGSADSESRGPETT